MKLIALNPRLSEKAYGLSELRNTYIFDVESAVNKFDVAKAVASQYDVKVANVRIAGVPGKAKRAYRQRGRKSLEGQRSDIRKAYVTLNKGDSLPLFAAAEETEAKEPAVQTKAAKTADRQTIKESQSEGKSVRRGLRLRQNRGGDK